LKIGIIGSGAVAKVLAAGFEAHGHVVMISSRSPEKVREVATNPSAQVGTFSESARFGELVVLAVKGTAAMDALHAATASNLAGKPVIDATNPIADSLPSNGVLQYFTDLNQSLMEQLQREFVDARFVKAFNSVGSPCMVNPKFTGGKFTMFICGNDESAKRIVSGILDELGWEAEDLGKAEAARAIEPLCMLWCIPGFLRNDWIHAFKLLR
jgi:predicted dinucleotide-binding enzyme